MIRWKVVCLLKMCHHFLLQIVPCLKTNNDNVTKESTNEKCVEFSKNKCSNLLIFHFLSQTEIYYLHFLCFVSLALLSLLGIRKKTLTIANGYFFNVHHIGVHERFLLDHLVSVFSILDETVSAAAVPVYLGSLGIVVVNL